MKRTKFLALTLVTCLLFALVGCGKSNVPVITETAETFLQAMDNADMTIISEKCDSTVLSNLGLEMLDPEYNETDFYTGLGIDKSVLCEDAQASVTAFCEYFSENLVKGYSINEVTEEDGVGYVKATLTTYTDESLADLSGDDFNTQLTNLMTKYQEDNLNALMDIYTNEGENAMLIKIFDDLMPDIMDLMKGNFDSFVAEDVEITLELEEVDGNWMVTGAKVY